MTPERWRQIEEMFQTAVDMPPSERPRFIRQASAGDETLFEQVVALVNQYESAGDFIEEPALNASQFNPTDPFITSPLTGPLDTVDPSIGRRIGAYILSREVGRGGMGAVYEAFRADGDTSRFTSALSADTASGSRPATRNRSTRSGCSPRVFPSPMNLANWSVDLRLGGTRDSSAPSPGVAMSRYGSGQRVPGKVGGPISTRRSTRLG